MPKRTKKPPISGSLLTALMLGIIMCLPAPGLEARNASTLQEALDEIAGSHYASHISTLLGNVTWEDTGIGTGFSEYIRDQLIRAISESDYYSHVRSSGPVFNSPEAALLLGPDGWSGAGYLTWGNFRIEESSIVVDLEVFSFIFNQTIGRKRITLPLSLIPEGTRIVPEDLSLFRQIDSELGDLFSESSVKVHVTTSRGDGGLYRNGEALELYILTSADCYIKIFHIDSTGTVTTQIFPNQYETRNFLPGGRLLKFPGPGAPFIFRLTPPFGREYIKVVASETPFSDSGNSFQDMGVATRGLFIEAAQPAQQGNMAEASVSFTINP